ncbi:hypothetical protein GCM10015535_41550 [Streptomyces gelaticus]|uniref:Uncharacterized protein n=1 Tax=Streptomyces gelaticus TaxID=285446 RepID=A0ABQ2W231_9ACTN|nr:hypothetical protein GCM10015535_41550 [Streptomyces gelaticus]
MWLVIAVEVSVYLMWLAKVGHRTEQQLPRGDVAQWAPPVLLPLATALFCVAAGWAWWESVVAHIAWTMPTPRRQLWAAPPEFGRWPPRT